MSLRSIFLVISAFFPFACKTAKLLVLSKISIAALNLSLSLKLCIEAYLPSMGFCDCNGCILSVGFFTAVKKS